MGKEPYLCSKDWLQRRCRALKAAGHPYTYTFSFSCWLFLTYVILISTCEVKCQSSDVWRSHTRTHTFTCGYGSWFAQMCTQVPPPPPHKLLFLLLPPSSSWVSSLPSPTLTIQHSANKGIQVRPSPWPWVVVPPLLHLPGTPPLGWHTIMAHRHFSFVFWFYDYFYYKCA